jgi:ribosomal protein S18 acetylase RimI-like enzyme
MDFRPLTLNDLTAAMALDNSIQTSPSWHPGPSKYQKSIIENGLNFGAFEKNVLIGKVGFNSIDENEFDIDNMIVAEKYQHQGIGKQLFSYALNELVNTKRPKKIILFTYPKNTGAISLYEQFGFVQKEIIQNKYGPGMHRVRMEKMM